MKTRKKIRQILLVILLLCSCTGLLRVQAATAKADALQAYRNYLENQRSFLKFSVIYLDKDAIPELVLNDGKIFTYKKSTGMKLLQDDYEFDYKKYYKKKGVICSDIIMGAMMGYDVVVYSRVANGKLKGFCRSHHYTNGKWEYAKYSRSRISKVAKAQFNALIRKYAGKKKLTKIKYHANTAADRDRYL